jgi:hypothetical protein
MRATLALLALGLGYISPVGLPLLAPAFGLSPAPPAATHPRVPAAKASHPELHPALPNPLNQQDQAAQVVDRFTFGPTPGMLRVVAAEGWQQWFDQQLHPAALPDTLLDKHLQAFPSLQLAPAQLAVAFPDGQAIRRIAEGKQDMPADPQLAGVYQVLLARYQAKQETERADASATANPGAPVTPASQAQQAGMLQQLKNVERARATTLAGPLLALPPAARLSAVLAMPVPDRLVLAQGLPQPLKQELLTGVSPHDRELLTMMASGYGGNGVAANELEQARIVRAVLSQRQLLEVMTDFWVNHFNIDLGKSGDEINYANQFERDAIRPHALGRFSDLLLATSESPAMMIYLDNLTSIGADSPAATRQKNRKAGRDSGLNENYGREVMELHTLGVDGGYTQADVTALSNILTGWTVDRPQQGGPFEFLPQRHEPGPKQWLHHTVNENGQQEGIDALRYLAQDPATARHISFELAQRFVNDTPPPALVDRMVAAWQASDGDIAQVLEAMVHSPEFFDRRNFNNKVKTPLEFVASALRATNTDPTNPGVLTQQLRAMGEPLYRCQPPTGYPNTGSSWMNSGALVDRLNFALALSEGRLGGMHLDAPLLMASQVLDPAKTGIGLGLGNAPASAHSHLVAASIPGANPAAIQAASGEDNALTLLEQALLAGEISPQTNAVIRQQLAQRDPAADAADPAAALDTMVAMILGAPEFQVH